MVNTHDKLSHHDTDTLPMPTNGPYNKGPAVGEKRGYQSN